MSVERAMAGAGLTVGAFYAHFKGKDDLLQHAFQQALDEIGEVLRSNANGMPPRKALVELTSWYLGEGHRDQHAKDGCPMPAVVASAVPVGDKSMHHLVARGIATLSKRCFEIGAGQLTEDRALALVTLLIGGQIVARATRGSPLSAKTLAVCRRAAREMLGVEEGDL